MKKITTITIGQTVFKDTEISIKRLWFSNENT